MFVGKMAAASLCNVSTESFGSARYNRSLKYFSYLKCCLPDDHMKLIISVCNEESREVNTSCPQNLTG